MTTWRRPQWKIETRTGDRPPHQEWIELRSHRERFQFADREDAERMLARLQKVQPQVEFRIAPI